MKYDMTGGATVLGAMRAIAQLKPPIPILGVAPCTENLPSGKATKPGDVVKAMTGKTIEIINTDAEGRLILADAIAYAKKLGATKIIDMATLTGAVSIALGDVNAAVLGTDQELIDEIIEAGREVGEKFWQLPLDKEYSKQIKSDIADIKNVGGRKAGTITAAAFLKGVCRRDFLGAPRHRRDGLGRRCEAVPVERPDRESRCGRCCGSWTARAPKGCGLTTVSLAVDTGCLR